MTTITHKSQRTVAIIALGLAAKHYRVFGTAVWSGEITDLKQASGGAVSLSRCNISEKSRAEM